jgi:hypothetical protein
MVQLSVYNTSKNALLIPTDSDRIRNIEMPGPVIGLFLLTSLEMKMLFVSLHERQHVTFLGTFAKLRKTTVSFVMSACPSIRMGELSYH